tara:strand:- start:143813 stop:144484 length:672 start_codon:yes stop_codon:yes gene_type:complete
MVPALSYSNRPSEEPDELSGLVASASEGDESAWVRLVDLYSRRVFAMAQSRLHDAELAEEITQSVFVTIATKLNGSGPGGSGYTEQNRFEPWLFRITMNRVRDYCRKRSRHARPMAPEHFASVEGAQQDDLNDRDEQQSQLSSLRNAMDQLTDTDREIIELRHHGQMSFKQIAEMTGVPIGTLLARHHRALKKLRGCIEPEQDSKQDTKQIDHPKQDQSEAKP